MIETIGGLLALFVALAVVAGVALAAHWGQRRERGLMPYIVYPILLIYALSILMSGRDLSVPVELGGAAAVAKPALVAWLGRLTSLFIVFACGERILRRFLAAGPKPAAPGLLLLGFWTYVLSNAVSPALLGRHPSVTHEVLYVMLSGHAAILIGRQDEFETLVRSVRNALLLFLAAGASFLLWRPGMVLDTNYHGLIPLLNARYAGLASHANSMGPFAVLFLLSLWRLPLRRPALNRLAWALGLASLVLTQSKTSWIAFLLCLACLAYFGAHDGLQQRLRDIKRPHLPALLVVALMFGGAALCMLFMFGGVGDRLARFWSSEEGASLISFSGRDQIWQVALQEWYKNPVFGYGLQIWDEAFRNGIGMPHAVHAHNQFFQSLSSAGTVGAAGLVLYTGVLVYFVCKTVRSSGGLSLALFILLVVKAISEVPLSVVGLSVDLLAHLLLLAVLASHAPQRAAAAAPPRAAAFAGGAR